MDSKYDHTQVESRIYRMWETSGYFTPKIDPKKKPFTIILPLPNASDPMHMGHALFTVEDILVRYHRMKGDPTLWLPGGDHAGIETQYIFEKHLAKEGKSRFDFDRDTLYKMIWDFANANKDLNKNQMKQLGFSLDWTRYHYSLEPEIVDRVLATFKKLHDDGLVYRGERIVNFCTHCGTAFSELEVDYVERQDFLYYLDYGPVKIATTRPETIFADVAVAVNPKDKKYKASVGKKALIPLIDVEIPIITADQIDTKFGTGALKVTPGYDPVDFAIGQKNKLETIIIIDRRGKMVGNPRVPAELVGLNIKQARAKTVELLTAAGKLIKTEPLAHSVGTCYRCGTTIEPMVIPQWYVKTKPLAKPAMAAVKNGTTKIFPKKRFEKLYFDWMENIRDWNISRQIVWGPQIPVWYCLDCNPDIIVNRVSGGIQSIIAPKDATYQLEPGTCQKCRGQNLVQETDTFDTWFLSDQWPVNVLKSKPGDFEYFYPTSVLDTLWDILFFWVARMMMFGLYLTNEVPFKAVHIHARVVDAKGQKMSKSKGNVINPIEMVDKYGADALRMALVISVAPAGDIMISDDKVRGLRNFSNKIWNIARFLGLSAAGQKSAGPKDHELTEKIQSLISTTTKDLDNYRFGLASENLYQFIWHDFADKYIEDYKQGQISYPILKESFQTLLALLHPFMPFVTEEIWGLLGNKTPLIVSSWPK
ncbi:valine--tRNA ligase [Candidatus Microgenomates bacterium]|nr:valine--tRNA ligase [Candidatus Microgenomates bacterium]